MKFSEQWLRRFVHTDLSAEEIARRLTMAGLEVEALEPVAAFEGVVVARIVETAPHPNADKLQVCKVDAGEEELLTVVCGAPNARADIRVPLARLGARLPGMVIGKAKVRGVASSGMMCSGRELGLSDDQGGLLELPMDTPIGSDLRDALELRDHLFTLKLTPNRADCLGVQGISREVAALVGTSVQFPAVPAVPVTLPDRLAVDVQAPELCGRFSGRVIRGVDATARTPDWMRQRLERSGQRCISVLVDISNYVMLELNRPNHVFDLGKVHGGLAVRWAREGESLLLLNGSTIALDGTVGVIADEAGVESLAGIMGGESTSVSLDTRDVYVEAAFWWPEAVAGRSRRYNFSSEAGHRFERGVDFADTVVGVERVTQLILEICGGEAGPVDDQVLNLPGREPVALRTTRAAKVIGVQLTGDRVAEIFGGLGFDFERTGDDFRVTPPTWRFDITIEEDLIEEIARIYGYDKIPAPPPQATAVMLPVSESRRTQWDLRRLVAARDYQEVVTYSFVEAAWEADFCGVADPVALANPIASHLSVMRSSLIGGLVSVLASNQRRQASRVRVFELGRCFLRAADDDGVSGFRQPRRIAGLAWGAAAPEQWGVPSRPVDFFDVKADVEACVSPIQATFVRTDHPALHPGRSASVVVDGVAIGYVGELHPRWAQKYELGVPAVVFELNLEPLLLRAKPRYTEVSRQPAIVRDLALTVPESVAVADLLASMREAAHEVVSDVTLFDVYRGKGVEPERKSLAFRVVMQDTEKTLSDAEADAAIRSLIDQVSGKFSARLRA